MTVWIIDKKYCIFDKSKKKNLKLFENVELLLTIGITFPFLQQLLASIYGFADETTLKCHNMLIQVGPALQQG